jgi:hypothetical protein
LVCMHRLASGTHCASCAQHRWNYLDSPVDVTRYLNAVEAYVASGEPRDLTRAGESAEPLFAHYEGYYQDLRRSGQN